MNTSESINEIAAAMAKAQAEIKGAVRDASNPYYKSRYASLESVRDACLGPLTAHGIAVFQSPSTEGACVSVETLLAHASGQWVRGTISATAKDDSPQSVGSAISYLRRYALQSFAGVAPEDDDAEAAQGRHVPPAQAPPDPIPTGYQQWLDDMTAVADEGTQALELAWKGSKVEYRSHLTRTNKAHWEQLKIKAQEASVLRTEL